MASRGFLITNVVLWVGAAAVLGYVFLKNNPRSTDGEPVVVAADGRPAAAPAAGTQRATGGATAKGGTAVAELRPVPKVDERGFFIEDFYQQQAYDLQADLAAATSQGKILLVMWEREFCEYCQQLHEQLLRDPKLHDYLANTFYTVRYDFYARSGKMVKDFDGVALREDDLARRHRVLGTPALEFRVEGGKEVLRIPGLVDAEVLLIAFEFAQNRIWESGKNINQYLIETGVIGGPTHEVR
jgi:thioredoxin-related protein